MDTIFGRVSNEITIKRQPYAWTLNKSRDYNKIMLSFSTG